MTTNSPFKLPGSTLKPHSTPRIKSILSFLFPKSKDKFDAAFLNKNVDKSDEKKPFIYAQRFQIKYAGILKGEPYHHYTIEALTQEDIDRLNTAVQKVYKDAKALNHIWNERNENRYKNFGFGSEAEVAIALELHLRKVLFFSNPTCLIFDRDGEHSQKRPDFIVFYQGKARILEVDGKQHHEAAFEDYKRDRIFERHGLRTTRFTADECLTNYERVVDEFLELFNDGISINTVWGWQVES